MAPLGEHGSLMSTIERKLQIREGMEGGVYGRPPEVRLPFPNLPNLKKNRLDFAVVFVTRTADITQLALPAIRAIKEDGLLWFAYPKKSGAIKTDISRDHGWEPVVDLGFEGCRQIAVDDTWSAIRFREPRFSRKGR